MARSAVQRIIALRVNRPLAMLLAVMDNLAWIYSLGELA
jgi:hypothetical protein